MILSYRLTEWSCLYAPSNTRHVGPVVVRLIMMVIHFTVMNAVLIMGTVTTVPLPHSVMRKKNGAPIHVITSGTTVETLALTIAVFVSFLLAIRALIGLTVSQLFMG